MPPPIFKLLSQLHTFKMSVYLQRFDTELVSVPTPRRIQVFCLTYIRQLIVLPQRECVLHMSAWVHRVTMSFPLTVCVCACVCVCVYAVWLTCYGVHGLSAVVGALWGALTSGEPPCGAAGEVHVRPAGSWTPQPAPWVKHPPHMPHATGFIVKQPLRNISGASSYYHTNHNFNCLHDFLNNCTTAATSRYILNFCS